MFIHGKSDKVIPWKHSLSLMEKCKCPAKLVTPEKMEHNYFNTKHDIAANMKEFLRKVVKTTVGENDDNTDENERIDTKVHFPIFMFKNPKSL